MKNKLFVIEKEPNSSEVFDKLCKRFVAIKSPRINAIFLQAVSVGSKIIVAQDDQSVAICYDVDENEWSETTCEVLCFFPSVMFSAFFLA